jgi:hypothetical protein
MSDVDGRLEYRGFFLRAEGTGPVSESDLQIDGKAKGNRFNFLYFKEQLIPIIRLRDGTILLPAEAYQEAKTHLERQQEVNRKP